MIPRRTEKNKKYIYVGLGIAVILIIAGIFVFLKSNSSGGSSLMDKISPVSVIKYVDENSSIVITKNNIDKTAKINMDLFMEESEVQNEFMDLTEFMTTMSCGLMQMAFFNATALEEFNKAIQEWNEMDGVVEDDTGKEIGEPESNPLEGYQVKEFTFSLKDKDTKRELSSCKVSGPSEEDRVIKIN